MTASWLDDRFYRPLLGDPAIAALFSTRSTINRWLEFEVTLAKVQGDLGLIPAAAAAAIDQTAATFTLDPATLETGLRRDGVPIRTFLSFFRQQLPEDVRPYVHWGATTQDVMDTALVLQLEAALDLLTGRLETTIRQLISLIQTHRHTVMAGRTHSQHALPITFGLKAAGWLAPLLRHRERLTPLRRRLAQLQFGGAAGTLAALGDRGMVVQDRLATLLGLAVPPLPWHTQRDTLVELASWLAMLNGSLGKMGQDVILLTQSEVAELRETADPARGGSSTMPQKQNPVVSELLIAAARTSGSLLSNMVQAMVQEHERATHGWQMEWLTLPHMVELTGAALGHAVDLTANLVVRTAQMKATIVRSRGLLLAEAASFALAAHMDRAAAQALVRETVLECLEKEMHLFDRLPQKTAAPVAWDELRREENYLGSADLFINRTLTLAEEVLP